MSIAGLWVKSLPLDAVKWLVVVVVIYTAAAMLRSAAREGRQGRPQDVDNVDSRDSLDNLDRTGGDARSL